MVTVEFFKKSAEVYDIYSVQVLNTYYKANSHLEEGIVSELDGKPAPAHFRACLKDLEELSEHLAKLERSMRELVELDQKSAKLKVPVYEDTVKKMLREARPFERVSLNGVR